MIKTKVVTLKVNPSNLKNLRQYLPDIKSGEIVKIPVSYLTSGSHTKIDAICDICNIVKNISYKDYYKSFSNGGYYCCSQKCSKQKVINTNIAKYGFDNPSKSQEVKDKIKASFQEKYGVDNISFLPEIVDRIKLNVNKTYSENIDSIKDKQKETNLRKYGVEDINKEGWFKDRIRESNIEKYGVDNTSKLKITQDKIKATCKNKYGFESAFQSEEIRDKIKNTNIERYGVENVFQSEEIKDKIKETNVKKYGVEYISQNPEMYEKRILSGFRIRKHECGLNYQGTYERDFIDFCILNEIEITKPPSFLYEMNGVSKRYYPDFYYERLNLIIEVKSSYYYQLHKEKNELKRKSIIDNGFEYILILDKNYNEFIKLIYK